MLQAGKTGTEILTILDAITGDSVAQDTVEVDAPTLQEIEFWYKRLCRSVNWHKPPLQGHRFDPYWLHTKQTKPNGNHFDRFL